MFTGTVAGVIITTTVQNLPAQKRMPPTECHIYHGSNDPIWVEICFLLTYDHSQKCNTRLYSPFERYFLTAGRETEAFVFIWEERRHPNYRAV